MQTWTHINKNWQHYFRLWHQQKYINLLPISFQSVWLIFLSSTDSAPRLPTKHLLARLNPQPVHIVVMGTRQLNIYCCSEQNGQRNASVTSVIRLTSQMCYRTMRVWWNSSSLWDIGTSVPPPHIVSAWRARHDNNNKQHIQHTISVPKLVNKFLRS